MGSSADVMYLPNEVRLMVSNVIDGKLPIAGAVTELKRMLKEGEIQESTITRFKTCYTDRVALILSRVKSS